MNCMPKALKHSLFLFFNVGLSLGLSAQFNAETKQYVLYQSYNDTSQNPTAYQGNAYTQNPIFKWYDTKNAQKPGIFYKPLIHLSEDSLYEININPIVDFSSFSSNHPSDTLNLYTNSRGLSIQGTLGKKIRFFSAFVENQAIFPQYIRNEIAATGVVPGQARTKPFKIVGVDYAQAWGTVEYLISKNQHISFGSGKKFIGNGYRSLVLSDNSFQYPFLEYRAFSSNKKWSYQYLYAWMNSLQRSAEHTTPEAVFHPKNFTLHTLEYRPHPSVLLSLIDHSLWSRGDSLQIRPAKTISYQPIPLLNYMLSPQENSAYLSLNAAFTVPKKGQLYAQITKSKHQNAPAFQLGISPWIKTQKTFAFLRLEYNHVPTGLTEPNTFAFSDYSHNNNSLGHPSGAGLKEQLIQVHYRYKRFALETLYTQTKYIQSTNQMTHLNLSVHYTINPSYQLQVFTSYIARTIHIAGNSQQQKSVQFGLRTNLYNQYFHF